MAAPAPLGGPGIPADWALVPIHPDLKYQDFFEAFSGYMFNGRVEGFYGYRAEVHNPMFVEIEATDHHFDQIVNVHRKYVTHFFRNNPRGAQQALQQYLDFVLNGIHNRGLEEIWGTYGSESVLPFIRSYVEHGASVQELREFIQNYINEHVYLYPDEHDPVLQQLKESILTILTPAEMVKKIADEAFNRRKDALIGWQRAQHVYGYGGDEAAPGNGSQGGGRRRRSTRKRTASKKTRRSHRVSHRK
jgi:hypothetical protein